MSLRALGGGDLSGDRLVRIVYLDEAGTSKKQVEPYVVVSGVIVHGDHQLGRLRAELADVMDRHIPPDDQKALVLHAADIYGGNGYFDKRRKPEWNDWEKRARILDDLAALPGKLNLWVPWGFVEKDKMPYDELVADEGPRSFNTIAVATAYTVCLVDVNEWFKKNAKREHCFIVVEDNHEARGFIKTIHRRHQDNDFAAAALSANAADIFPLAHISEDPNFQEKRVAHPLVLADFMAFMIKRRLMKDARAERFVAPFWDRLSHRAS